MNRRQIVELFKINLLYANPQTTNQLRSKGKNSRQIVRSLLFQFLLMGGIFTVIYGGIMLPYDFPNLPGFFTLYCTMFVALAFSQSVSVLYNVFYDSKDLKDYLPLPFRRSSVFFAKFLIVALTVLPFLLPVFALFLITSVKTGLFLPLGIVSSLLLFAAFFLICFSLSSLVVSFLVQTSVFNKHKSVYTTLLMLIPTIGMALGMVYLNSQQSAVYQSSVQIIDQRIIYPFYPFYQMIVDPFQASSLIYLIGTLVILFGLYQVIRKVTIPNMYTFASGETKSTTSVIVNETQKVNHFESLSRQLLNYNLTLIKNPTLLMQVFTSIFLVPVMMIVPSMLNGGLSFSNIANDFFIAGVMIGLVYSLFTINPTSIISMIISLDRENLLFVRSLPIDFKGYLKAKFQFAFLLQLSLTSIAVIILSLVTKVPLIIVLGVLLGNLIGSYIGCAYYFYRDYRLMTLNWTSISQLFNRGGGNFTVIFSMFGILIAGAIIIGAVIFGIIMTPFALLINLVTLIGLILFMILVFFHYQNKLWKQNLEDEQSEF